MSLVMPDTPLRLADWGSSVPMRADTWAPWSSSTTCTSSSRSCSRTRRTRCSPGLGWVTVVAASNSPALHFCHSHFQPSSLSLLNFPMEYSATTSDWDAEASLLQLGQLRRLDAQARHIVRQWPQSRFRSNKLWILDVVEKTELNIGDCSRKISESWLLSTMKHTHMFSCNIKNSYVMACYSLIVMSVISFLR